MPTSAHIYVHYPFCRSKCGYCDFFSVPQDDANHALSRNWFTMVADEMRMWRDAGDLGTDVPIATLYVGGGSPSLAEPVSLAEFLETVRAEFRIAPDAEITLEVQPGTADPAKLREFARAGVNRFSVGVQSFDPRRLELLGRCHTVDQARALARGVEGAAVSLDLICAIPGQSLDDWRWELEQAVALEPSHISAYELTFHPGTRMTRKMEAGQWTPAPEELRVAMFGETARMLAAAGYEHYEISNHARPGSRSRHNLVYWELDDFVGLGAGAHSFVFPHRYVNANDIGAYAEAIRCGRLMRERSDASDHDMFVLENLQMAMRLLDGVDLRRFGGKFGIDMSATFGARFAELAREGLIEMRDERLHLTREGCLKLDSVIRMLL